MVQSICENEPVSGDVRSPPPSHHVDDSPDHDSSTSHLDRSTITSNVDAEIQPLDTKPRRRIFRDPRQLSGWRTGAVLAVFTASVSLVINICVGVWAARSGGTGSPFVKVFLGDCRKARTMNTWVHLGINAISTALLAGSNYCMQCLSSPTRKDIKKAHAERKWLDIGVPSVRNLRGIGWDRVLLWWLLALSSIPLHLLYNSAFFSSLVTNDYNILYVTEDFVTGASFDTNDTDLALKSLGQDLTYLTSVQNQIETYKRLEIGDCMRAYAEDFTTDRRTVIIVGTSSEAGNNTLLLSETASLPPISLSGYEACQWCANDIFGNAHWRIMKRQDLLRSPPQIKDSCFR